MPEGEGLWKFLFDPDQSHLAKCDICLWVKRFVLDMINTKGCNGFSIEFRQSFAKETFSYDEYLKS